MHMDGAAGGRIRYATIYFRLRLCASLKPHLVTQRPLALIWASRAFEEDRKAENRASRLLYEF